MDIVSGYFTMSHLEIGIYKNVLCRNTEWRHITSCYPYHISSVGFEFEFYYFPQDISVHLVAPFPLYKPVIFNIINTMEVRMWITVFGLMIPLTFAFVIVMFWYMKCTNWNRLVRNDPILVMVTTLGGITEALPILIKSGLAGRTCT